MPVKTKGRLQLSDVGTMINECVAGSGIAQILSIGVQPLLSSGRLIDLFPEWPGEVFPLYALHPSRQHPRPHETLIKLALSSFPLDRILKCATNLILALDYCCFHIGKAFAPPLHDQENYVNIAVFKDPYCRQVR